MTRLAPWLGPALILAALAGLPARSTPPDAGSPASVPRGPGGAGAPRSVPSRPFVVEGRSCKPAAPVELALDALEPGPDGRVTLRLGGRARERLGGIDWHLDLPPGARVHAGATHGRLAPGEELAARVEVTWPDAAEVTTAALVATAPLEAQPGERVTARRALHRLPTDPARVPAPSGPSGSRAGAAGGAAGPARATVPALWRAGR